MGQQAVGPHLFEVMCLFSSDQGHIKSTNDAVKVGCVFSHLLLLPEAEEKEFVSGKSEGGAFSDVSALGGR